MKKLSIDRTLNPRDNIIISVTRVGLYALQSRPIYSMVLKGCVNIIAICMTNYQLITYMIGWRPQSATHLYIDYGNFGYHWCLERICHLMVYSDNHIHPKFDERWWVLVIKISQSRRYQAWAKARTIKKSLGGSNVRYGALFYISTSIRTNMLHNDI